MAGGPMDTNARREALAFYRRFYTPKLEIPIVVVAGDVTAEEVKQDAAETYGKIAPRAEIAPRKRPDGAGTGGVADCHPCRSSRRTAEP